MAEPKIQYAPMPYGLRQGATAGLTTRGIAGVEATLDAAMPDFSVDTPAARGRSAAVAYSPTQKKFFVSGPQGAFTFDEDNDTAALESAKIFDPSKPAPLPPGDWQPLTDAGYAQYIEGIRNPSMKKLAKKNFGIGVDNLQGLVGSGLKFAGAEETGQKIIDQQEQDLSKTLPYQRTASDIGSDANRGILDWFVANLAQQGPNIVESAVTAVLGAAAGGAAGAATGPGAAVTAAGGAFAALVGKAGFKAGMLAAAKKYSRGELLEAGEAKLLMEAAGITAAADDVALKLGLDTVAKATFKQAGRVGGAGLATLVSNEAMGVADIYSEPGATRGYAAAGSIPYALLESSTEFLLAGRLFGDIVSGGKPLRDLGYTRKAMELLRRTSVGGTVGGVLEGTVEAGQEALLMAANPVVDWDSPESVTRLFNSFAAGAGVGGPIGSIANLKGRAEPANLLNPTQSADPSQPPASSPAPAPAGQAVTPPPAGIRGIGTQEPASILGNQIPGNLDQAPPVGPAPSVGMNQPSGATAALVPAPTVQADQGTVTMGGASALLARRRPVPAPTLNTVPEPITAPKPPIDLRRGYGGNVAAPVSTPIPAFEPAPLSTSGAAPVATAAEAAPAAVAPELNADFYPQAPAAQAIDLSQYVPASQPNVTLNAGQQLKGKKAPIRVLKATKPELLTRDYSKIADLLTNEAPPANVALAERLATMNDNNLKKLVPVWNERFEPDVTNKPDEVMALIDRTLGVKGAKLKKGLTAAPQKEIVTETVTEQVPAKAAGLVPTAKGVTAASPTKGQALKKPVAVKEAKPSTAPAPVVPPAAKVTPTEAARDVPSGATPLGRAEKLKKPKPLPPPESAVKNAAGVAAPDKETASKSETNAELNNAIETWNDPKDTEDRELAARYVISTAFFGDSNDKTFGRVNKALATLDSMLADVSREGGDAGVALDRAIVGEALTNEDAPKRKEFQALIKKRGLRDRIITKAEPGSQILELVSDQQRLVAIVDEMLTNRAEMQDAGYRSRKANDAKVLYNAVRKGGDDPIIHGVKASQLFKNNRLDVQKDTETGLFRLAVGMDVARDVMVASDAPSGMFSRVSDDAPLTKKFSPGETKMRAAAILNKFKFKPKLGVFRNVADLKATDPRLYKRAAAARSNGDFDSVNAVGYSFADHVILFTDFIRDERHLLLTLSHETLGHFGLRAFMSQAQLKQELDAVYNADTRLAQKVDQIVADTGMDKHEALEEYLADYAASIDNSLLRSIWNVLKNALNKLGITFEDDHARLLLNQARRYVRHGGTGGSAFSAVSLYDRMEQMAAEAGEGRYSQDPLNGEHLSSKALTMQAMSSAAGRMNGMLGAGPYLKKYGPGDTFGAVGNSVKDTVAKIVGAVETLDFRAARSEGLGAVYKLFEAQHNRSRQILTQLQQLTSFTHKANWVIGNKDAPVEKDKEDAGELLAYATLSKLGKVDTALMDSYGDLITVDELGNITENDKAIAELMKDGFVTADEFRKGLTWKDSLGNEVTYPAREIDEGSKYWRIYKEQREAVNVAAMHVLRANHNALSGQRLTIFEPMAEMKSLTGDHFTAEDLTTLREISQKFYKLYLTDMTKKDAAVKLSPDSVAKAERFMESVARVMDDKYGDKKLQDWLAGEDDTSEFQDPEYKKIIAGLSGLSKMRLRDRDSNKLKQTLQNVVISQVDALNAEYYAKRTILTSYAPLKRDGKFQVRLTALGEDGKPVALATEYEGVMPYYREDDEKAAINIRRDLDALFKDKTYTVQDVVGAEVKVTFVAEHSTAKQTPDLGDVMDYANFIYILDRQGISITPAERQRLVTGLTAQGSMARSNLQRTGNPGWRSNMVRNISEHLETSAHVAAKRTYRNQMDAVIDNDRAWKGDKDKLARLKAAYKKPGLSPTMRDYAKREYDEYASKYAYMANASEGAAVDIEVNNKTKSLPLRGKGEEAREEAKKLLRWQAQVLDITDSTEDILSTNIGAKLKTMTVLAQLGMSVATAFVNVGSLATHSTTYMAFYNPRNGFGMGFGMAKSSTAITRALGELKNNSFTDPKFIKKLIDDKKFADYGLTKDDAEFLLEQTTNGTLQPALFNALIGSARGKTQGNRVNDAIQKWMYMFSYTESLNRRVTGLAAYRLELARLKASTTLSEDEMHKQASTAAHKAIITSQGEYSMFNRPELARGNFGQYIFMYKMFTAITVQMMRSLPPSGRLSFLAMMIVASGIKGVPFAEDIMDLIDTLAQMFGIKMTSIEKEAYQLFDGLAPGYAPYFMRGALDQLTGSTVSSKVGMGDIIPLSGSLKYGADPWNETKQFVGPVFGATMGMAGWAQMATKYGAETVGLKSDATTFNDLLRNSPLAVMRSIGDSMAYVETGAITNIRGQIVSRDAGVSTYIARLLGFYPAESTRQNDIIRLSKMGGEYAKAIKSELVNAYVQAGIRGDKDTMKHISKQVLEWNVDAKGTGLEVKEFQLAVKKSLAEASREAILRFRRSVSKQMQPQVDELMRLQGVDPTN